MSHGTLLVDWTMSKENFKRFVICPFFFSVSILPLSAIYHIF